MKQPTTLFSASQHSGVLGEPHAALFLSGTWFSFQKHIDLPRLVQRRAQTTARNIINAMFVFLAALGFSFVLFEIWKYQESDTDVLSFLMQRSPSFLVFSITLLFDLAIIARFGRMKDEEISIPRAYKSSVTAAPNLSTWEDAKRFVASSEDASKYFTAETLHVLEEAYLLARRFNHVEVLPSHILTSLLGERDVRLVFIRIGLRMDAMQRRLATIFASCQKGETRWAVASERLLLLAFREAVSRDMRRVSPIHLLQVLCREDTDAYDVLFDLGVDDAMLTNTVEWILFQRSADKDYQTWRSLAIKKPKGAMNRSYTAVATPLLDTFSRDLTQAARSGALETTIDRETDFDEIFRIFSSGQRGVLLVGFPGVGKRSIVEGIAARMASEEVPEILQDKRFVELSLTSLIGSSSRQGELEERIMRIMNEIIRSGNIVLFIENVENLIGLSTEGAQNLDASEMIVKTVEQYGIPLIATTTPVAFREHVERSNLVSVLQKVSIDEVDTNGAILICEGRSSGIEIKNDIFFTYGAIARAVELSRRYFHEQYLPEKALTLLEEVASYVAQAKGKRTFVIDEDVATIVSQRANVPVTKVTQKESEKLLNLEELMHGRIIGQDEAVKAVASALRRARAELRDQKRPIANFLFLGPTGVGKTELAKTVADVYFGDENTMIRLDMSEYQTQEGLYRLIGAPGATTGGHLTEAVRTNPFSLVLLDELEKAHPDILNVFLQVMDDGRLTDTLGRTIDFTNTIIIATSNAGSQYIQDQIRKRASVQSIKDDLLNSELRQYFRPEFLNRFDAVVVFTPLSLEEIKQVVKLMLAEVAKRMEAKGILFTANDAAIQELATIGYDPVFGARPLRRTIQERVDNALAQAFLTNQISRRDTAILEPGGVMRIKKAREL